MMTHTQNGFLTSSAPSTSSSSSGRRLHLGEEKLGPLDDMNMNAYMDASYFVDPSLPSSSSSSSYVDDRRGYRSTQSAEEQAAAAKKADEDLETLLKETDGIRELVNHVDLGDPFRGEQARQRKAAAARSRYQRMSENERKKYNSLRRLKQLGIDPETLLRDGAPAKVVLGKANAKKAEAARMRYHRMTPEQKRDYNRRRTEAFRKRRREEEQLLSTPAGRISSEALAKAQQIMVRNARKAESARLRYQKMTPEERKNYNMKRASAKKFKKTGEHMPQYLENLELQNLQNMQNLQNLQNQQNVQNLQNQLEEEHLEEDEPEDLEESDPEDVEPEEEVFLTPEEHINHVINEISHPTPQLAIFNQMEKEVERRTLRARANLHNQFVNDISVADGSNAIVGGIQYDVAPPFLNLQNPLPPIQNLPPRIPNPPLPIYQKFIPNPGEVIEEEPSVDKSNASHVIDEKMLHEMVRTGVDGNGLPVEVRTVEGKRIMSVEDLIAISHGQTVLITQQHFDSKAGSEYSDEEDEEDEDGNLNPTELKTKVTRAKRAERARARYHRMSVDQRREQNAKRALMLRNMRARDDHLCHIADTVPFDQIDSKTAQAIREAQQRRIRRAQQARSKYHRMDPAQKKRYNANRDAQRRQKREAERAAVTLDMSTATLADIVHQQFQQAQSQQSQQQQQQVFYTHVTSSEGN